MSNAIEQWYLASTFLSILMSLGYQIALIVVALQARKRVEGSGWIFLLVAALGMMANTVLAPLATWGLYYLGPDVIIGQAVLSMIQTLIGGTWWAVLLYGMWRVVQAPRSPEA